MYVEYTIIYVVKIVKSFTGETTNPHGGQTVGVAFYRELPLRLVAQQSPSNHL